MSSIKEKIKEQYEALKIKAEAYFSSEPTTETTPETPAVTEQKFGEYPLEDGSIIKTDTPDLAVGSAVQVKNEAGEFVAIPDGEYKCMLADGSMLAIKVEAGIITEMAPVAKTEEAPAEQEQSEQAPTDNFRAEIDEIKSELSALKEQIKSLAEGNTKLSEENTSGKAIVISLSKDNETLKKDNERLKEIAKDTLALVQMLSETPVSEPTQKPADKAVQRAKPFTSAEELRKHIGN